MIEVEGLTYAYGRAAPAVDDLSFKIGDAEIFGFLGPSGAGKSTTQKILMRLLKGYHGRVSVMGRPLEGVGADYFEKVGVCFELPSNYRKLTALENLRFFAAFYEGETVRPEEVLEWVGLSDAATKRVEQFSKGMQIRLNLARALINRPKLLFLDEPTAGLDPVNARAIRDLIRAQRERGATVFLTTHDMHVADELCDRVGFLVDGRLVRIGAPEALRLEHGGRVVRVRYESEGQDRTDDFSLDDLGANAGFQGVISNHRIHSMHSQEPSLEDVFIKITGKGLV